MNLADLAVTLMDNPSWRNAINFLVDLLDCTRFEAAALLARAMNEGYLQ